MANEKINEYVTERLLDSIDDGDFLDFDALISTVPDVFDSQKVSVLTLKILLRPRTAEVVVDGAAAAAGFIDVLFANDFVTGVVPVVLCIDNSGIVGLGNTSIEVAGGFRVIVSNPGTFKYIASYPF